MTGDGPDFICIGAQKAGTSWLHWNLSFHPQAAMPPEKEINYFFPCKSRILLRRLGDAYPQEDTGEYYLYMDKWRQAKDAKTPGFPYKWYERYFCNPRTLGNYRALFTRPKGKVSGDMSPAYARMPEHYVRKMARAAPNARIIFLLREPVERAWSQFRMAHPTLLASECIAERMRKIHDTNWIYSRYSRTLDLWQRWFPGRLRVFFYDQIAEEPEKLFGDICGFLGISAVTNFDHNKIRQKVFEGPNAAMPNDVRRYFSDLFSDEVEAIHKRYNNSYTKRWLTSLQSR